MNCKNCGAPITIQRAECQYCGTAYPDFLGSSKTILYGDDKPVVVLDSFSIGKMVHDNIMTMKEARRIMSYE